MLFYICSFRDSGCFSRESNIIFDRIADNKIFDRHLLPSKNTENSLNICNSLPYIWEMGKKAS